MVVGEAQMALDGGARGGESDEVDRAGGGGVLQARGGVGEACATTLPSALVMRRCAAESER